MRTPPTTSPAVVVLVAILLTACSAVYYAETNINSVSIGTSKDTLMRAWPAKGDIPGLSIRAARRTASGTLLEVGEIPMVSDEKERSGTRKIRTYWFLFEDGKLAQWGRPEDWRETSKRYDIHFNPTVGVPR